MAKKKRNKKLKAWLRLIKRLKQDLAASGNDITVKR
jgi:hypothetical protein